MKIRWKYLKKWHRKKQQRLLQKCSMKSRKQTVEKVVAEEPAIKNLLFEKATPEEEKQPATELIVERKTDSQDIPEATFESFSVENQETIIRLSPDERTIVNAGPGTGKTWTLIEKLKYMLNDQNVSPENILVLCFSRAAVEVIRDRLKAAAEKDELPMNWHMVDVRTFDSFATYLLSWAKENIPEQLPEKYALECHSYDDRISEATNLFQKQEDLLAGYQHVIVDEVQDLVGVRAQLVLSLLNALPEDCGFTLLGDSCQGIYDYLSDADKTIMSSTEFYHAVFDKFRQANYFFSGQKLSSGWHVRRICDSVSECDFNREQQGSVQSCGESVRENPNS